MVTRLGSVGLAGSEGCRRRSHSNRGQEGKVIANLQGVLLGCNVAGIKVIAAFIEALPQLVLQGREFVGDPKHRAATVLYGHVGFAKVNEGFSVLGKIVREPRLDVVVSLCQLKQDEELALYRAASL